MTSCMRFDRVSDKSKNERFTAHERGTSVLKHSMRPRELQPPSDVRVTSSATLPSKTTFYQIVSPLPRLHPERVRGPRLPESEVERRVVLNNPHPRQTSNKNFLLTKFSTPFVPTTSLSSKNHTIATSPAAPRDEVVVPSYDKPQHFYPVSLCPGSSVSTSISNRPIGGGSRKGS